MSTVPIEIKYKLASVIMTLRFIFKTVEPKILKDLLTLPLEDTVI